MWSVNHVTNNFTIDQKGELSFKEASNYEDRKEYTNVKVTATPTLTGQFNVTEKTIRISIKNNEEETRLTKFQNSGFTFTFGALLLFLLEIRIDFILSR